MENHTSEKADQTFFLPNPKTAKHLLSLQHNRNTMSIHSTLVAEHDDLRERIDNALRTMYCNGKKRGVIELMDETGYEHTVVCFRDQRLLSNNGFGVTVDEENVYVVRNVLLNDADFVPIFVENTKQVSIDKLLYVVELMEEKYSSK